MKTPAKSLLYRMMNPWVERNTALRNGCIGLCYHRFEEPAEADPLPGMAVTAELFQKQVGALRKLGPFISIDDLVAGRTPEGLSFFLSFDDGYRDNVTVLLPLLEDLEVPCCIYVTSGFVAGEFDAFRHDREVGYQPAPLNAADLRTLAASPRVTIGAHTRTHPNLGTYEVETWDSELSGSRKWLEDNLQRPVTHFAFPFGQPGDLDWPAAARVLPEAGYSSVASNFGGMNRQGAMERIQCGDRILTHIRRVPIAATPDIHIFKGWTLGLCNRREWWKPRAYLAP